MQRQNLISVSLPKTTHNRLKLQQCYSGLFDKMFSVLMLVNILIAMFSDTYSKIKEREDVIFKFQRLELLVVRHNSYQLGVRNINFWHNLSKII